MARDYSPMEHRLVEVGHRLNDEPPHYWAQQSIFQKIKEEQRNAGQRSYGLKPDIVVVDGEATACMPDGGLGDLVDRMGGDIARDNRVQEIIDLLHFLPRQEMETFIAIYVGPEIPRSERAASALLGVSREEYRERRAALIGWFNGAMYRSLTVATFAQQSDA